ncbi:MAG: thioredoxin fold domain-containing protein [Thermaceae bacterium]
MFLLILGLALSPALGSAGAPDRGRWYPYSQALELAQTYGRMVMAYFHSPYCPYCDQMNTFVLSDPGVDGFLRERFVVASVNTYTPEGQALAWRYRVPGVPTFVFLVPKKGAWEEVGRIFGSRPRAQFLNELRAFCAKGGGFE